MSLKIVCVGKVKESFFRDAIKEYQKRLGRYCRLEILEVGDEKTPEGASEAMEDAIREKEGTRILEKIPSDSYVIALAITGKSYSSEAFAKHLGTLEVEGKSNLIFVIGGSLGLSEKVLQRAAEQVSFSAMTYPHQLMRVILLEQIYRSYRIRKGEPYHK